MITKFALGIADVCGVRDRIDVDRELRRGLIDHPVMNIFEGPVPRPRAECVRPQRVEPLHRNLLQRSVQLARNNAGRPRVARCGDQLRRDAGEGAVEDEFGAGAEIEDEIFEPDLGDFRRIDRVQLTLFDSNDALRQPFALQLALA